MMPPLRQPASASARKALRRRNGQHRTHCLSTNVGVLLHTLMSVLSVQPCCTDTVHSLGLGCQIFSHQKKRVLCFFAFSTKINTSTYRNSPIFIRSSAGSFSHLLNAKQSVTYMVRRSLTHERLLGTRVSIHHANNILFLLTPSRGPTIVCGCKSPGRGAPGAGGEQQ